MHLVFGHRNYGKADQVGDFCYVTTQFFHLWFIPLIPVQSFIILTGTESKNSLKTARPGDGLAHWLGVHESNDSFEGRHINLSRKSILWAWIRALLYLSAPIVFGLAVFTTHEALIYQPNEIVIGALVLWVALLSIATTLALTFRQSPIGLLSYPLSFPGLRVILYLATPIVFVLALLRTSDAVSERPNALLIGPLLLWFALAGIIATLALTYRLSRPGLTTCALDGGSTRNVTTGDGAVYPSRPDGRRIGDGCGRTAQTRRELSLRR